MSSKSKLNSLENGLRQKGLKEVDNPRTQSPEKRSPEEKNSDIPSHIEQEKSH